MTLAFHSHTDCNLIDSHILILHSRTLPLSEIGSFSFFIYRCLLFRPLYHHHLCQCRSGSDGTPDASFPNSLQAKLHGTGLPVTAAVHHRAPSLQRKPIPGGICSQILPLQRCRAQLLFSHLHSGREIS